ncbi:MAG: DUF4352 domain-containing protein [Desulfurococcales archaeon]|nr:DUF4352 domain-containing protein [Desulfurococcales archaeon]
MRKGISPVIATVIIVAVAIAISIAVAGWLMGLWGTFGATEQLQVLPNSTLTTANTSNLKVCVKNTGSKSATVTEIEVVGVATLAQANLSADPSFQVGPGEVACFTGTVTGINAGAQYAIKVYTDSGGVYQGYVVAQSG